MLNYNRCIVLLVSILLSGYPLLFAQDKIPVSDPQAVSLAAKALLALTNGTPLTDVTLNGKVSWTAGDDVETGTGTFNGKGQSESRVDLALSNLSRTDVRNGTSGVPLGNWFGADGVVHKYADHNSWSDAVWFFPGLSSLANSSASNIILAYVGPEMRRGVNVMHIHSYIYAVGQDPLTISRVQAMSAMDFYLDSTSMLPVVVTFNVHPDNDSNTNMAVEVDFSDFRSINGFQVPHHIQKLFQGTLQIDLAVTDARINAGIPDSIFNLQ